MKGIHSTKVHKDCPFTIEELDEFRDDLLNVATANGLPTHPSWAAGHQRHQTRQATKQAERRERLVKLHAQALGLYMAFRMNGHTGEVQKARLDRIAQEIDRISG